VKCLQGHGDITLIHGILFAHYIQLAYLAIMLLTYVQLEVFISGKMHFTKIGDASTYNAIPTNAVHQCICMCLNGLHFEL